MQTPTTQSIETGRHEYRMRSWQKWIFLCLGLFLTGIGVFLGAIVVGQAKENALALLAIFPLACGVWLLLLPLRSRLVIDGTRIAVCGVFGEKTADISEVEGFRTINTRNGSFWQLRLKQGRGSITIQKWFDCDDLRAWFQQLTDLDEQNRKELLSEIEQNQELGATPEERLNALKRAKTWSVALTAVAVIVAVSLFVPGGQWRWPAAVILALVPLAVLYLLNREPLLFALGKSRRDPRSELSIALLAASMGLFFSGIQSHFVSMMPLLPLMAVVVLAFIAAFTMLGRKGPRAQGFWAMVILWGGLYSFGLIASCDTLLDHSNARPYQAQVAGKHLVNGKSTTYYLDFRPWGPFAGASKVSVPYSVYQAAQPGDTVCFDEYPGALHAAWFRRVACGASQEMQSTQ